MQDATAARIPDVFNRGPRRDNGLIVLNNTTIPAVLVEVAFMDNANDAALLATEEFRQRAAQGIAQGILDIFKIYTPER
jgi:N-acetylmuramoyl-L-alanine amidase